MMHIFKIKFVYKKKKSELLPKNTKQIMSIVHRANFVIMVLKD